jgi:hypothetical protein
MIVMLCDEHKNCGSDVGDSAVILSEGDCWFLLCDRAGYVPRVIPVVRGE